jgi:tRNA(adenine34) deaminase
MPETLPPDTHWMRLALAQAALAGQAGEVPVGAVVVKNGELIAVGHNAPIGQHDPTAHAEIAALRAAAKALGNYRLDGCELFVTLEPCAMCAGAMLHARLKRVVFGAPEPRTGAAGSVLNLFTPSDLNHQTEVLGGVLASECAAVLHDFFKPKRVTMNPVRDDALRTPDDCFTHLPDYPWQPNYLSDLPALDGLRMHYLDEGPPDAATTYLCLHGNPAWSYLYRKMIPVFAGAGQRVIAPDLIGFGKSDKPKKDSAHTFTFHRQVLLEFIDRLNLRNIVLVVQDWGGILGLTLPMAAPERFSGLLVMNTMLATGDVPLSPGFVAWRGWCEKNPEFDVGRLLARGNPQMTEEEWQAYNAPFPDRGHRAALRAFPQRVPENTTDDGAALSRSARDFWLNNWTGKSFMAIGQQDPVLGEPVMRHLQSQIRGCSEVLVLPQAGHFVQEHGEAIAKAALGIFNPR